MFEMQYAQRNETAGVSRKNARQPLPISSSYKIRHGDYPGHPSEDLNFVGATGRSLYYGGLPSIDFTIYLPL